MIFSNDLPTIIETHKAVREIHRQRIITGKREISPMVSRKELKQVFTAAACTECFHDAVKNVETNVIYCGICNIEIQPDGTFVSRKETSASFEGLILRM